MTVYNISNVMVNMNKYFVFQNIQSYNCNLIKCNNLILLFKYLNNTFFKSLYIFYKNKIKRKSLDNDVD